METINGKVEVVWDNCPECKITTPMAKYTLPSLKEITRYRCLNCLKLFERKLVSKNRWPY